jgi:type I restriction enzyme M protein
MRENKVLSKAPDLDEILSALKTLPDKKRWMSRNAFLSDVKKALKTSDITLSAPQWKALISVLSEHDEAAEVCLDAKGRPEPNADLRDTENVPLKEDIEEYFKREVLPHVPDAWIDHEKTKVGYEIPFTRHFYKFQQPRSLQEIDSDLKTVTDEILELLHEVTN